MDRSSHDVTALLQEWSAGDVDAALSRLATFDPRKNQLAELRFFGGLSLAEAAEALGISPATAERDWRAARAWLFKELHGGRRHDPHDA